MAVTDTLKRSAKVVRSAAWLGWQLESNWADPAIFAIITIIRPLASLLIIIFMFRFALGASASADLLNFFFIGNTVYLFVYNVLFGISQVIFEDREHYEVIKYIYISPVNWYLYFIGRGFARLIIAGVSCVVSIVAGLIFLPLKFNMTAAAVPVFAFSFLLGIVSIFFMGIIMCALTLVMARHGNMMSESISGIFFILCGIIYPISALPVWLQKISTAIPISYWLEISRRLILNTDQTIDAAWHGVSTADLVYRLGFSTAVLFAFSVVFFYYMSMLARAKGIIDRTTSY
ncbi:MAG: hypothetical protein A2008_01210 [Candidatus Wallbacteria bacterium GWC2_49_35]|uniref:Transport permease protein n=1 Tax=Candidatus Wallbacteria bacterium GWC2_49_35 TaxID=1817813 RepID=A0A1F7WQQ0_9BACT|nr:MAG: hypothetical protein A2008_01210 [Candidatus Wallbacteria bacterium GWC2_49_35]HBC74944.1 hypothetical protein [Candidatus Wallbacteria bacterium]